MEIKLEARNRVETGKSAVRKLREGGEVPAVMYGHGIEPLSLAVKKDALRDVIRGDAGINVLIDLQVVEGKNRDGHLVMIKELQKHPLREKLMHVDFLKVARDEKVTMKVPVAIRGEEESAGLRAGGTLQHNLWEVEVECLPAEVPDHILADIGDINIGDHLTVADLEPVPGITILAEPQDVVLTVLAPRLVEEAPSEEEAAAGEEVAAAEEEAVEAASGESAAEKE